MIANLSGFKIKGGCFTEETNFPSIIQRNINLVYGRNGSGKSTIASAIKESINAETATPNYLINFSPSADETDRQHIFVFNEDFIEKSVKLSPDGLNTIVMMGELLEIDNQITDAKERLKVAKAKYEKTNLRISELNSPANDYSVTSYFKKIRSEFANKTGWAERDGLIRGWHKKGTINEALIFHLKELEYEYKEIDVHDAISKLEEAIKLFSKTSDTETCHDLFFQFKLPKSINDLNLLLAREIERPTLSGRDEQILSIITSQHNYIHEAKSFLDSNDADICPFCFQPLSGDYKNNLARLIEFSLNRDSELYKQEIESIISLFKNIDYTSCSNQAKKFISNDLDALNSIGAEINIMIIRIKDCLTARTKNIYEPFENRIPTTINELITKYNNQIELLNSKIASINEIIADREKEKEKLLHQNNFLAYTEHKYLIDTYVNLYNERKVLEIDANALEQTIAKINQEISELKQKKLNTNLPLDIINEILSFIFFDKDRIKLEPAVNKYQLLINGEMIQPSKVSIGERNAIALSYFFACVSQGKTRNTRYDDETLIVLDDPVSSFDFDNKVGILSALRWQIASVFKGNPKSKFLIFSHDAATIQDFIKITDDLVNGQKRIFKEITCSLAQLSNKKLDYLFQNFKKRSEPNSPYKKWNVYGSLVQSVFNFANLSSESLDLQNLPIGNEIRKMLEAYSSFVYSMGVTEMLHSEDITRNIGDTERNLFENCMSRLILNDDSHMQEQAHALSAATDNFSFRERQKIARAALKFLTLINEQHIAAYLSNEEIAVIKTWHFC